MNRFIREWLPYIVIIVFIVFIRSFIITPVIVRGDSMYDTLKNRDVLLLSKISYRVHDIRRFDIVVIKDNASGFIIKRIIGLPGDNVYYKDNKLYINDKEYSHHFTDDVTDDFTLEDICEIKNTECNGKIPNDMYLVLGDNRDVSADSRIKGLIDKKDILGHAVYRIWPVNVFGSI